MENDQNSIVMESIMEDPKGKYTDVGKSINERKWVDPDLMKCRDMDRYMDHQRKESYYEFVQE